MSLDAAPVYFRSDVVRAAPLGLVDRKRRVIESYAVVTSGEAVSHGLWLDKQFLEQVKEAGNAAEKGIKSRFTHPGLSSDGLGKALGRSRAFKVMGDKVEADLHLLKAASKAPDGDLAGYVMELAEEDPEVFGASIVFMRDVEAEREFQKAHSPIDEETGEVDFRKFKSPDKQNKKNLRHARLRSLRASDVVDDPAANPGGFFSAGEELAARADTALAYVLGLAQDAPQEVAFGVHPERARQFVTRFLSGRGLELRSTAPQQEEAPVAETEKAEALEAPARKTATLADLKAAFSGRPAFVLEQLEAEATIEEAKTAFLHLELAEQKAANAKLTAKVEELGKRQPPAPAKTSGVDPLDLASEGSESIDGGGGNFLKRARALAEEKGITKRAAMSQLCDEEPELWEAWNDECQTKKRRIKRRRKG